MNMKPLLVLGYLCAALTAYGQGTLVLAPSSVDLIIAPFQDRANFTFPTPNVSLANYTGESVTFSAPDGYAWRFDPSLASSFECCVSYGSLGNIGDGNSTYSFNFVPGMENTVSLSPSYEQLGDAETAFYIDAHFQFGGAVEFTSLTVDNGHYVSLDMYLRHLPLGPFSQAYLDGSSGHLNGGLSLVPIPEPNMAAFVLLVPLIVVFPGRRLRNRPKA